jgi:hypothetical protein
MAPLVGQQPESGDVEHHQCQILTGHCGDPWLRYFETLGFLRQLLLPTRGSAGDGMMAVAPAGRRSVVKLGANRNSVNHCEIGTA